MEVGRKGTVSLVSGMVSSKFGDESNFAEGKCRIRTVWPESLVARVLTYSSRNPRFEHTIGSCVPSR